LPLRRNGARLTMNAVVSVSGPGRLAIPKTAQKMLPVRVAQTACQKKSPDETMRAP
jgi:hypothetical protein